jgi:CheY-like chemotaxis protein
MSGYRYLYVEDEPLNREVMQTLLLEVIGVGELITFADSADFIARLKALDPLPDFVLLDVQVAPHDGHAMLAMIRADDATKHLKTLAVSAGLMPHRLAQYRAAGFDGVIAKPLDMMTFPDIIRRLEGGESVWQVE